MVEYHFLFIVGWEFIYHYKRKIIEQKLGLEEDHPHHHESQGHDRNWG